MNYNDSMTLNEALSIIKNPFELNRKDAAIEGFGDSVEGDNTFGYRIYILDDKGYRYSPAHPEMGVKNMPLESGVYYWHNRLIAQAYMVYLALSLPQYNYGLFPVEAIKGNRLERELVYNEHSAHYGQYASELRVMQDAPVQILTPEMLKTAQENPDIELFSK